MKQRLKQIALAVACAMVLKAHAADVAFTAKPRVMPADTGAKIAFAVSAPTDVEVAVLDARGAVVRHLAAGLLGSNAPEPLQKDALSQEISWNGKDDVGQPAMGGPFQVRVRAGSMARLDQIVGWDGNSLGAHIVGLAVGRNGEVYVLDSDSFLVGRSNVRVLDRNGRYLRTIMPYPASTPKERTATIGQLELDVDGKGASGMGAKERLPIVFNAHSGTLSPLISGMRKQNMVWNPRGHLVMAGGVGTYVEHGVPRHLLALHPAGGAPEGMNFVGPQMHKARGFLGGQGDLGKYFDHLAASRDGETLYFVPFNGKAGSAVYRLKWTDKEMGAPFLGKINEPGNDDAHLSDPQGLATDQENRLYVCDRGNQRVMIFSAAGALLGKFPVENPEQIAISAVSGEIFIVTRPKSAIEADADTGEMSMAQFREWKKRQAELRKLPPPVICLRKFSAWLPDRQPTELDRLDAPIDLMALDVEAKPARLWVTLGGGLLPVAEKDGRLALGESVSNTKGMYYPAFLAADPTRPRLLVREMYAGQKPLRELDLTTGVKTPFLPGSEAAFDRQGNIYCMGNYGSGALFRYDPAGQPLPFSATHTNRLVVGAYRAGGPDVGLRGHCVAPNGDIYIMRSPGAYCAVDVFGPDGVLKKRDLVAGMHEGASGVGVDAAGNVYVGVNVRPADKPYPEPFLGQIPAQGWVWWREPREGFWQYPYYNPYLYHWGSVFKFGPAGGSFYGLHSLVRKDKGGAVPLSFATNAPAGAVAYKSGYLRADVKVAGALWRYAAGGVVPTSDVGWGDPSCSCISSRLAVDPYGRVFVPDSFLFSLDMLDANGNRISRIGRYGNADAAGPEIAFAWPAFAAVAGGKVYVSDPGNRRVMGIRFDYAAAETVALENRAK